jgi:hypothetical protein
MNQRDDDSSGDFDHEGTEITHDFENFEKHEKHGDLGADHEGPMRAGYPRFDSKHSRLKPAARENRVERIEDYDEKTRRVIEEFWAVGEGSSSEVSENPTGIRYHTLHDQFDGGDLYNVKRSHQVCRRKAQHDNQRNKCTSNTGGGITPAGRGQHRNVIPGVQEDGNMSEEDEDTHATRNQGDAARHANPHHHKRDQYAIMQSQPMLEDQSRENGAAPVDRIREEQRVREASHTPCDINQNPATHTQVRTQHSSDEQYRNVNIDEHLTHVKTQRRKSRQDVLHTPRSRNSKETQDAQDADNHGSQDAVQSQKEQDTCLDKDSTQRHAGEQHPMDSDGSWPEFTCADGSQEELESESMHWNPRWDEDVKHADEGAGETKGQSYSTR